MGDINVRVLVACEFSGRVRDAFLRRGHDAVSCDVLESESPGPHLQCDVRDVLGDPWDMLIGFPPCTYLTVANAWRWEEIAEQRLQALLFVAALMDAPIPRICVENPVGAINSLWKPTQTVHPWMFGEPFLKRTCLWLQELPPLKPTVLVEPPETVPFITNRSRRFVNVSDGSRKGESRTKDRSRTFASIAEAMAEQWG